jgi:hypothetical protein
MGHGKRQPVVLISSNILRQVEDKFSPFGKETLAKLIGFLEVRRSSMNI